MGQDCAVGGERQVSQAVMPGVELCVFRPDQARIVRKMLAHDGHIAVAMMGRRWGKTILGGTLALSGMFAGWNVAWVAPSFPQARTLWRWVLDATRDMHSHMHISRAERSIRVGAGQITIYSALADTTIRGNAFDLVVVDEAARVPEEVWSATIVPTLADRKGRALLISTPKGKNWFWREWMRGVQGDPSYSAWKAPSNANPIPSIQEAYRQARERLPARIFAQEWDAEPVDDAGGVFVGVRQRVKQLERAGDVILACDLGRDEDYTAVAVFDVAQQAVLRVERWRGLPYTETTSRIARLAREVDARAVAVEANAMGAAVADYLEQVGVPVERVMTTRVSKQRIIEQLSAAIERGEVVLPPDDYVLTELENYTARRRADGGYEYSAPAGLHDDCVMAIAWAYECGRRASGAMVEVW